MSRHIALVEDDPHLRKNYSEALSREGYQVSIYRNRVEAMNAFDKALPDLAILDIILDDETEAGFEICRELRQKSSAIPIIFLTARDSDVDRVSGLRLGAWDYLTKSTTTLDFLPVRVTALFRAIAALKNPTAMATCITRGDLIMDEERKQASWKNKPLSLTLTEFWILHALVKNPGHVKDHSQLMDAARVIVTDNAITAHIKRIRRKFREIDREFDCIRSEYGMGYRWTD